MAGRGNVDWFYWYLVILRVLEEWHLYEILQDFRSFLAVTQIWFAIVTRIRKSINYPKREPILNPAKSFVKVEIIIQGSSKFGGSF